MKLKLPKDLMEKLNSLATSNTEYRMNHEGCPAGEDRKSRLYYKVTDDGKMLLAHCFNCGGSGGIRRKGFGVRTEPMVAPDGRRHASEENLVDILVWKISEPIIDNPCPERWPEKYLQDCWEDFVMYKGFGIRRVRHRGAWVIMPRGPEDDPIGFECRYDYPNGTKECTTSTREDHRNSSRMTVYNVSNSKTALLCEDPISAIKVALAGYCGVCLFGTNLSQDDAFKLSMLYDRFVVWLDNDKPEVIEKSKQIQDRLFTFTDNVTRIVVLSDPKHYEVAGIKRYVEDNTK